MNPLFGPAFGLLMVVSAGATGGPVVLAVLGLAVIAVGVGLADSRAATAAVLLSITALALSDPSPLFAAVSGMSAAAYLVNRHGAASGAVTMTVPTVAGLIGFTAAGLAATAGGAAGAGLSKGGGTGLAAAGLDGGLAVVDGAAGGGV